MGNSESVELAKVDLQKTKIQLEEETKRETQKLETKLLDQKTKFDNLKLALDARKEELKHERKKHLKDLEYMAMSKLYERGLDPRDFNYCLAGIARCLRNETDTTDADIRYLDHVMQHKLSLQGNVHPQAPAEETKADNMNKGIQRCPISRGNNYNNEKKKKNVFNEFQNNFSDLDNLDEEQKLELEAK